MSCYRSRAVVAAIAAAATIVAVGGCGVTEQGRSAERSEQRPASPEEVAAEVAGRPVRAEEVVARMRPTPPRVGAEAPADPRGEALGEVVRVKLFAAEAERVGMRAPEDDPPELAEARLAQGLAERELERRSVAVGAKAVSGAEARRYYDENREDFEETNLVHLSAIVVEDPGLAERLLKEAEGVSGEEFARLVEEHSVDEASKERGGHLGEIDETGAAGHDHGGLDASLTRVGLAMRDAGQVGLAEGPDGRYYVLRGDEVGTTVVPYDGELELSIKSFLAEGRRERVLGDLEGRLRKNAEVVTHDGVLGRIEVPPWTG